MATQMDLGKLARTIAKTNICRTLLVVFATLAITFLLTGTGRAQSDTGRVTGTVTDSSGALIPGAAVTLTNTATGVIQTATSGNDGNYSFAAITRGNYTVSVTATGFQTATESFELQVSQVKNAGDKIRPVRICQVLAP
jgi:hypothetical protein